MPKKGFTFTLLLTVIVSCIYLLRVNHASLSNSLMRVLQQVTEIPVNEPMCDGVTIKPVSESDRQKSNDIRSDITSIQSTNHLNEFIEGPDPKDDLFSDYLGPLIGKSVQWIVFFGIGVIVLLLCQIAFLCAWCSARRRLKQGKVIHVGGGTKFYLAMSIFFMIPLLGADIASLIYTTTQVEPGADKVVCSIAIFGDQIEFGNLQENWIGAVPLNTSAIAAVALMPATTQNLSYTSGATDRSSVNAAFTTVSGSVTTFYQDNEGQTIDRADPAFTTAYVPTYIENLGPPSNTSTESGEILSEMQDKRDRVVGASQNISSAISQLKLLDQFPAISGPLLQNAVRVANESAYSVRVATDKLKEYANDFGNVVDDLAIAMIVVLSVDIGFVALAFLAIFLLCFGVQWVRRFFHFSWCMIGLLMTFTWVLATILWAAAIAVNDVCQTADAILADPAFYNQTANKFFPDAEYAYAKELLYSCLHGDGDVLEVLGQRENLQPYEAMFSGLNNVENLTEARQTVPDSIVIPAQQFQVSQIEAGFVSDDPLTDTDLTKLNSFTHSNTNGCTQVEDTWILNSGNCTNTMGTVFASSSAADFNVGNPTCIGFNAWGTKQIDARYNTDTFPQPSCGLIEGDDADVGLANYVDSFVAHQQNVATVFGNVQSGLTDVATANTAYMNTVTAATANIAPVWDQTTQIYPLLGSPATGILFNADCTFLIETFQMVEDQACVYLLPGIYRQMITLLVAAFTGLFAVPFMFCFSKRLLQQRKQDKAIEMGRQGSGPYKA